MIRFEQKKLVEMQHLLVAVSRHDDHQKRLAYSGPTPGNDNDEQHAASRKKCSSQMSFFLSFTLISFTVEETRSERQSNVAN